MDIGVGLDARLRLPLDQLRGLARDAAALGYDSMWTPAGGVPDAFHVCGQWSLVSSEVKPGGLITGTSVVPAARTWPVQALAMQAATLGIISGGRFILGIGTGGYGDGFWKSVKMPNKPIAVMRDYVTLLKRLLAGETVTYDGPAIQLNKASIGSGFPPVPVYLASLGPQMLRLVGECADGACLNWASPAQIAFSREQIAAGARKAGRNPDDVKVSMYIRVCIDEDEQAARRAFGEQVLSYAMARPGADNTMGYRGMFGHQGFDAVLTELERRRDAGESMDTLIDAAPDELLRLVGYYGKPEGAAAAYAKLSEGLDETIVRVITTKPDVEKVRLAMRTLNPSTIRPHMAVTA